MITKSEYIEAKKIVDEYERQQYQEKQGEAESDVNDWESEDEEDNYNDAAKCFCGAWQYDEGSPIKTADCVCD